MKVRDVMTREVLWLDADAPISAAAWTLAAEFISGAPVRDRDGMLVGVLSKADLVAELATPHTGGRVSDLMHPTVVSVKEDAQLEDAVDILLNRAVHRLLVTNEKGEIVGIVTALDVLRGIRHPTAA